ILFSIPCAVGLYLLADPVIAVLFQRGAFSAADTTATGIALMGFAIGLPAFIGIKVLQPSFFARENTFYPFIYGALGVLANIAISLTFFPIYGHVAIAIATSIAGWLTLVTMSLHLFISGWRPDRALVFGTLAILFSAALMAVVLYNSPFAPPEGGSNQTVSLALWLGGHILAGTVLFLFSALVTGAFGRDILGNFKSFDRASRLAKSDSLRDKADENEKDD
ncbi:MAG: lipid II flippase MurJ, partial [Pseudomonadota bacterium]|nr:lipid II flippase MurJ [Pseudomonadota bacterium]